MINQKLTRPARARNELLMARRLSARNYNAINKKSRNVSREAPPPPSPGCRSRSTARLIYYSGSARRTDGPTPHPSGPSAAREATRISPEHARTQPHRATGRLGARLRGGPLANSSDIRRHHQNAAPPFTETVRSSTPGEERRSDSIEKRLGGGPPRAGGGPHRSGRLTASRSSENIKTFSV